MFHVHFTFSLFHTRKHTYGSFSSYFIYFWFFYSSLNDLCYSSCSAIFINIFLLIFFPPKFKKNRKIKTTLKFLMKKYFNALWCKISDEIFFILWLTLNNGENFHLFEIPSGNLVLALSIYFLKILLEGYQTWANFLL